MEHSSRGLQGALSGWANARAKGCLGVVCFGGMRAAYRVSQFSKYTPRLWCLTTNSRGFARTALTDAQR